MGTEEGIEGVEKRGREWVIKERGKREKPVGGERGG